MKVFLDTIAYQRENQNSTVSAGPQAAFEAFQAAIDQVDAARLVERPSSYILTFKRQTFHFNMDSQGDVELADLSAEQIDYLRQFDMETESGLVGYFAALSQFGVMRGKDALELALAVINGESAEELLAKIMERSIDAAIVKVNNLAAELDSDTMMQHQTEAYSRMIGILKEIAIKNRD